MRWPRRGARHRSTGGRPLGREHAVLAPLLVVCDLHVDCLDGGPLGAPGAGAAADVLAAAFDAHVARPGRARPGPLGYGHAVVAVESGRWGRPPVTPPGCALPPHCASTDPATGLVGVEPAPAELFAWEVCPGCGGDPLAARADGRGQAFPITALVDPDLAGGMPAEVHVAGLAAEHGAVPLARAMAALPGLAGRVVLLAGASTFHAPAGRPAVLAAAAADGVRVDTATTLALP